MTLKKKEFNKTYLVALLFLTISSLLILVWFRDGFFYGGGDVGLPTYNPKRALEITKNIWWESAAPGFLIPQSVTSITLYLFLSVFESFGLGPVGMQALLFLGLLFLMGFGTYLLILSIIGKDKKVYATIGGLFYMFNPYMMVQIWHRFNNTSFFFVAAIPYLIMFWIGWIKSGNYLNLLFFLIVNLLASYMFGTLAYVIPLWLIISLFTISAIFFPWENKVYLFKVFFRGLFGLGMWILVNGWWLIPVATIGSGVTSQQHNIGESLITLNAVSKQAILPFSLQMINPFYVFSQAELGEIYKSFFFRLIPWLGVIVIFYGILRALQRKYLAFYVLIYFVIIMLSKGSSTPFGQFFLFLFSKFFVLGLLRNPFEKIGILLPLINSVLFTVGIEGFVEKFRKYLGNFGTISILVALFTVIGVYYWPMYRGTIFGTIGHPNYVEIPKSYKDADNWLNERAHRNSQSDGRILHLPLTRSDIVTYSWKYGYHGSEPSSLLFTSLPSISHGLSLHSTDDALTALSLMFHKPFSLQYDKILKLLQDFNVRFIILHKDLDWLGGDTYNPLETEKLLNSLNFIKNEAQFGDLVIYKVKDEFFSPKIELSNNISLVYPRKASIGLWPWLVSQKEKSFISPIKDDLDNNLKSSTNETLIFPENSFSYPEASISSLEETKQKLTTQLSIILGAVSYVKQLGIIHEETEEITQKIIMASQKLVEISQSPVGVDEYINLLNDIFPHFNDNSTLFIDVAKTTIVDLLKLHEVILSSIGSNLSDSEKIKISETDNKIKQFLAKEKLLPLFPYQGKITEVGQRQFYDFMINNDGKYELLLTNSKIKNAYINNLDKVSFQINNAIATQTGREADDVISFGEIDFKKGLNEVSLIAPSSNNLIPSLDDLNKIGNVKIQDGVVEMSVSKNSPSAIESPILHTVGEDIFQISFDAIIPANIRLYIQVIQDMDAEQNGQKVPRVSFLQHLSQSDWQGHYNIKLPSMSLSTREAKVRLIVLIPQEVINLNVVSTVTIKNLKLIRVLKDQIFLRGETEKENQSLTSGQILKMEQKTPVLYQGKIKIEHPTFLIFKEAFQPGWELELTRNSESYKIGEHYLANLYGNAWWIEKTGEYNFKIEFKPQQKVIWGIYLGLSGLVGVILLHLRSKFKQKYAHN